MPSSTGFSADAAPRVATLRDPELAERLRARGLHLKAGEARKLAEELGRDPSWAELFLFDAMWSEHCSYKSTRPMLKKHLPGSSPRVILGPGEDAGVVRVATGDGNYAVVMAHESHNHPSQVLPHEGAATGVGGILRDVACMGATVVGVMDGLRFGDVLGPEAARTRGVMRGVVEGIAHYGDAVGVPSLGGDVEFSAAYDENVLVNVVALGVCREEEIVRSRVPAAAHHEPYDLVLVGKPTDASGLGGASFASVTLAASEPGVGAVQLPDPFLKRVLLVAQAEVLRRAREGGVDVGLKDLGAGGLGCVASEIAAAGGFGVEVDLALETCVPADLPSEFALVAETQERFAWAVPRRFAREVLEIYNEQYALPRLYPGAGARVIGTFAPHGRFVVTRSGLPVADVPNELITAGISVERPARRREPPPPVRLSGVALPPPAELLRDWAGSLRGASRGPVFRFYDSEVQGRAVLRAGEADAGVCLLRWDGPEALAVTLDGNPWWLAADPRGGAAAAVCEACRNLAAAGASPVALTDCLNYGNPEDADVMGDLIAGLEGLSEASRELGESPGQPLPFISGNVSLYNQRAGGRSIPPSLTVAALGMLADYGTALTHRLKQAGDVILFIGVRAGNFSGSWIASHLGLPAAGALREASEQADAARREIGLVLRWGREGRIAAAHDVAEGGALWTAAEMALAGIPGEGLGLRFTAQWQADLLEEGCGFLVEAGATGADALATEAAASGLAAVRIAEVIGAARLEFASPGGEVALEALHRARESVLGDLLP